MIQLLGTRKVTVVVLYDVDTRAIEVSATDGNADEVLVALSKAVYAVLAGTVKVR